jgi:hypothetical protein
MVDSNEAPEAVMIERTTVERFPPARIRRAAGAAPPET